MRSRGQKFITVTLVSLTPIKYLVESVTACLGLRCLAWIYKIDYYYLGKGGGGVLFSCMDLF